jgi:hypothetical protein
MSSEADAASNDSVALMRAITEGKNPRGIPGAKFIVSHEITYSSSIQQKSDITYLLIAPLSIGYMTGIRARVFEDLRYRGNPGRP